MTGDERKVNGFLLAGGIVLVVCGVVVFAMPSLFLEFLTVWAGIGFIVSGVTGLISCFRARKAGEGLGLSLFMAALDFAIGLLLVIHPFAFATLVPWLLGIAFIVFGALEVMGTFPFALHIPELRTIMVISGVLSAVIGVMFIIWPSSLSIWVAVFAFVRGITLIAIGLTSR